MSPTAKFIIAVVVGIIVTLTVVIVAYGPDRQSGTPAVEQPVIPTAAATHTPMVASPSQITLGKCASLNHTTGEYGPCGMPATWRTCMDDALRTYDSMTSPGRTGTSIDRARGVLDWDMRMCDGLFPEGAP